MVPSVPEINWKSKLDVRLAWFLFPNFFLTVLQPNTKGDFTSLLVPHPTLTLSHISLCSGISSVGPDVWGLGLSLTSLLGWWIGCTFTWILLSCQTLVMPLEALWVDLTAPASTSLTTSYSMEYYSPWVTNLDLITSAPTYLEELSKGKNGFPCLLSPCSGTQSPNLILWFLDMSSWSSHHSTPTLFEIVHAPK